MFPFFRWMIKQFFLPGPSLPMCFYNFRTQLLGTLLCKVFPKTAPPYAFPSASRASSTLSSLHMALLDLDSLGKVPVFIVMFIVPRTATHAYLELFVERMSEETRDLKAVFLKTFLTILHGNLVMHMCTHTIGTQVHICLIFASYFMIHNVL